MWFPTVVLMLVTLLLVEGKPAGESVTLIFGGDINMDGPARYNAENGRCKYEDYFKPLKKYFEKADHTIVNLESPVSHRREQLADKKLNKGDAGIWLLGDSESTKALKANCIDTVSLANNHFTDYSDKGASDTIKSLKKEGVRFLGVTKEFNKTVTKPLIIVEKGVRIGLLGYIEDSEILASGVRPEQTIGPAIYKRKVAKQAVLELKKQVDFVILFMHWGEEYVSFPSTSPIVAGAAVDISPVKEAIEMKSWGVDAVIGSHPHITQHHAYYGDMLVVFSLGNLFFPAHLTNAKHFYTEGERFGTANDGNELMWYKMERRLHSSNKGKIVKLEIDSKTKKLVPSKSGYLPVDTRVDKSHCLKTSPRLGVDTWQEMCDGEKDLECAGKWGNDEMGLVTSQLIEEVDKELDFMKKLRKQVEKKEQSNKVLIGEEWIDGKMSKEEYEKIKKQGRPAVSKMFF